MDRDGGEIHYGRVRPVRNVINRRGIGGIWQRWAGRVMVVVEREREREICTGMERKSESDTWGGESERGKSKGFIYTYKTRSMYI